MKQRDFFPGKVVRLLISLGLVPGRLKYKLVHRIYELTGATFPTALKKVKK